MTRERVEPSSTIALMLSHTAPFVFYQSVLRLARKPIDLGETLQDHRLTDDQHRLENIIRESLATNDHDRIAKVVRQLCYDFAYAVHQPHARNGGLIGLAAAAIALGGVWLREVRTSEQD